MAFSGKVWRSTGLESPIISGRSGLFFSGFISLRTFLWMTTLSFSKRIMTKIRHITINVSIAIRLAFGFGHGLYLFPRRNPQSGVSIHCAGNR
ncbi:hypothetical protein QW060_08365 [Myroides ceti]|uniref:Uncharacterized protein n=1 Tax=Paenimyroides ceti TaxID=395087 RepID=A0ABT8CRL2_9FLAO|nr:hypothetical protein [Paenimyroides ceti]MDN3707148.1 hypothetical protein [Paenimyroides ceti]